jgi:hypothetical protein
LLQVEFIPEDSKHIPRDMGVSQRPDFDEEEAFNSPPIPTIDVTENYLSVTTL